MLVTERARSCKPEFVLVRGKASFKATSARWRAPREFCKRDNPSVTDKLRSQLFCVKPVSERARPKEQSVEIIPPAI